jgi:uncharacterized protein YndB with AHSA1/START domain
MSVNKDESGRRWIEVQTEVPGTVEEVWQAIATAEGVTAWFVPAEDIPGKEGEPARIVCHFGPGSSMDSVATRTAWDPPHRFAGQSAGLGPTSPPMATEWIVEAKSGDTCVVRVVHSLFASTDDWDDQLESIKGGWPKFFEILRLYLTHFRGLRSTTPQFMGMAPAPASAAWEPLADALGLIEAKKGERRRSQADAPAFAGIVEQADPTGVLMRIDEPAPGLAHLFTHTMGGQVLVAVRLYLYGDRGREAAAQVEPQWRALMARHYALMGEPTNV